MNALIDRLFDVMFNSGIDCRLIILVIAALPIAEARLAIPVALKCGLTPIEALCYSFLGSSLVVPVLLVALIPAIKRISKTKLFHRFGEAMLKRLDGKAEKISKKTEFKKILGTAAFVAVPLPLTGVWTGSAIACILGINYFKSLVAVVLGNLVASLIVLIITVALGEYINIIMTAFALIALIAAVVMLIKSIHPKKSA